MNQVKNLSSLEHFIKKMASLLTPISSFTPTKQIAKVIIQRKERKEELKNGMDTCMAGVRLIAMGITKFRLSDLPVILITPCLHISTLPSKKKMDKCIGYLTLYLKMMIWLMKNIYQ